MTSAASSSSTCIPATSFGSGRRELFGCSKLFSKEKFRRKLPLNKYVSDMNTNDITTSQSSFRNHLVAPRTRLLFHGKTPHRLPLGREKRLGSVWRDCIQILRMSNFKGWYLEKQYTPVIKAVATFETKFLAPNEDGHRCDPGLQFGPDLESQVFQSSNDDSPQMDDREKLRRMRISKANKGNVPWNKGRKHSAETLRRIRERTKIAMQDPKVKMKLVNLGHSQSEETRIKIGTGVREGWQRRRERLMVQESCCFEWQHMIAEASRKGYASEEDELQWDSYKTLNEQLKQEWLESVEKRKTIRPKGSKRAPKSLEQRRKISEAISAKWADPGYRDRVCTALSKYHGIPVGAERKPRRKPSGDTPSGKKEPMKKARQPKSINNEAKSIKKITSRKKRNATPSYKDPMASFKLEMIKNIRAQRAAMETKKREATERAKLLIAEAEMAALALEVAALKSPLARASLLETRKLIAEATQSIESIESGQLTSQDSRVDASLNPGGPVNHFQTSLETPISDKISNDRLVNGSYPLSLNEDDYNDFNFGEFTVQNAVNGREPLSTSESVQNSSELVHGSLSPLLQPNTVKKQSDTTDLQVNLSEVNNSISHKDLPPKREEEGALQMTSENSTMSATKTKRRWVCGRLIEAEED